MTSDCSCNQRPHTLDCDVYWGPFAPEDGTATQPAGSFVLPAPLRAPIPSPDQRSVLERILNASSLDEVHQMARTALGRISTSIAQPESIPQGRTFIWGQKPWVVTPEDVAVKWGCGKPGERLRCHLCGHRFQVGDVARWVIDNDGRSQGGMGNFFTCQKCDGPDVRQRWWAMCAEVRTRFWWLSHT